MSNSIGSSDLIPVCLMRVAGNYPELSERGAALIRTGAQLSSQCSVMSPAR